MSLYNKDIFAIFAVTNQNCTDMTDEELYERWDKIDKKIIEQWENIERSINPKPIPSVTEDGEYVCPMCNAKAYRKSTIRPCRPPAFTYCCLQCSYKIESRILLKGIEVLEK